MAMIKIGVYLGARRNLLEVHVGKFDPATVPGNVTVVRDGKVIASAAQARDDQSGIIDITLEEHVNRGPIEVIVTDRLHNEHARPIFSESISIGTMMWRI